MPKQRQYGEEREKKRLTKSHGNSYDGRNVESVKVVPLVGNEFLNRETLKGQIGSHDR